jgi:transposase-like protein
MSDRFDHTLEHTFDTKADAKAGAGVTAVRRIELITGTGRRRQWSEDEKARIVIESLKPGANVSEVARRNGLSPQQLFGWRREARDLMTESPGDAGVPVPAPVVPLAASRKRSRTRTPAVEHCPGAEPAVFTPVVVAVPPVPSMPLPPPAPPACGRIEIAIGDAVVRVHGQVEAQLLATVLRAVRRAS